jgi:hypothetical protein
MFLKRQILPQTSFSFHSLDVQTDGFDEKDITSGRGRFLPLRSVRGDLRLKTVLRASDYRRQRRHRLLERQPRVHRLKGRG